MEHTVTIPRDGEMARAMDLWLEPGTRREWLLCGVYAAMLRSQAVRCAMAPSESGVARESGAELHVYAEMITYEVMMGRHWSDHWDQVAGMVDTIIHMAGGLHLLALRLLRLDEFVQLGDSDIS